MVIVFTVAGRGQENSQQLAPPAVAPPLPERGGKAPNMDRPKLPDDYLLLPEMPPAEFPTRELPRKTPRTLRELMDEEAAAPAPVLAPARPESPAPVNPLPDLSRDVAMNQALSTGESLLGGLGGLENLLLSPFSAQPSLSEFENAGARPLRPIRFGPFDVHLYGSIGVLGTHVGGALFGDKFSTSPLYNGGFTAVMGRNTLSSLWVAYNFASSFPEKPSQSREFATRGGTGGSSSAGVDQTLSVMANLVFPELKRMRFVVGLDYASLSGFDRDTGGNAKRQIATALFIASYEQSNKTTFDWHVSAPFRLFSDAVSSSGVTNTFFATTQLSRKTRLGLGYTAGVVEADEGKNQFYQQGLVRWRYLPTRFLELDVTGGLDFRDIEGSFKTTPIFGVSATWDSGKGTLVSLAAERRIFNAASSINTNFTSSSIVLRVAQRLSWGMIGSVSAGYEYTEYERIGAGGEGQRKDKLSYVSAGLMVPVNRHWNFSLSCAAGRNVSNVTEFDFVQATLKTTLSF